MTISIPVDEALLKEAVAVTGEANVEKVLRLALEEFLAKRRQRPIDAMLELAGKVRIREDYDYKAMRAGNGDPD